MDGQDEGRGPGWRHPDRRPRAHGPRGRPRARGAAAGVSDFEMRGPRAGGGTRPPAQAEAEPNAVQRGGCRPGAPRIARPTARTRPPLARAASTPASRPRTRPSSEADARPLPRRAWTASARVATSSGRRRKKGEREEEVSFLSEGSEREHPPQPALSLFSLSLSALTHQPLQLLHRRPQPFQVFLARPDGVGGRNEAGIVFVDEGTQLGVEGLKREREKKKMERR